MLIGRDVLRLFKKVTLGLRTSVKFVATFEYTTDQYNGFHVNLKSFSGNEKAFEESLQVNLQQWQSQSVPAIWLAIELSQGHLISVAGRHGFVFHHAEGTTATLCRWLRKSPSMLPRFATHQVGVSGCVLRRDTNEALVVKDKNRPFSLWKFPGGLSDLGEDIQQTAMREIEEETGVQTEYIGVLAFRQQHKHPGAFGRSDLFYVCLLYALSTDLRPCALEIADCKWMTLNGINESTSAFTQKTMQLVKHGLKYGFNDVLITPEEYKAVYKGQTFKMYSRPVSDKITEYAHDIAEPKE